MSSLASTIFAAAAVEVEDDGKALPGLDGCGDVHEVFARPSAEVDRELLVAGWKLVRHAHRRAHRRDCERGGRARGGCERNDQFAHASHATERA